MVNEEMRKVCHGSRGLEQVEFFFMVFTASREAALWGGFSFALPLSREPLLPVNARRWQDSRVRAQTPSGPGVRQPVPITPSST